MNTQRLVIFFYLLIFACLSSRVLAMDNEEDTIETAETSLMALKQSLGQKQNDLCQIYQTKAQLLYDEHQLLQSGRELLGHVQKINQITAQKKQIVSKIGTSRHWIKNKTMRGKILKLLTPDGKATVMMYWRHIKENTSLEKRYIEPLLKDPHPEVRIIGNIILSNLNKEEFDPCVVEGANQFSDHLVYYTSFFQKYSRNPLQYMDQENRTLLKLLDTESKYRKLFDNEQSTAKDQYKNINKYCDQLQTIIEEDDKTQREERYQDRLDQLKNVVRKSHQNGFTDTLKYLKTLHDPNKLFPAILIQRVAHTEVDSQSTQSDTENRTSSEPAQASTSTLHKQKRKKGEPKKKKKQIKSHNAKVVSKVTESPQVETKSSGESIAEKQDAFIQDYIVGQETNARYTTIYDQLNQMKAAAYSFANKGHKVTIGKFSYARNVEQWYSNPDQALIDQGYTDPANPKNKYWRESPEKVIKIHRPSKKLQELIVEKGMQTTVHDKDDGQATCIKMFGHAELDDTGQKTTCMYRWLINPNTKVCFHYNIEFPKNIIEEILDHGCSAFDNPEFINIVFPKM